MRIKVKVKPNAGRNEIKRISEDYFEVKVSVTPEKGKANVRVIELLSKYFRVPKSSILITSGLKSKEKMIEIIE